VIEASRDGRRQAANQRKRSGLKCRTIVWGGSTMTPETHAISRTEQAGLWWVRLREDDVTPEEIAQWLAWCQSDPANLEAFENIDRLGGHLARLDLQARADSTHEALAEPAPVALFLPRRHWVSRWMPVLATAATVLVAVGAWWELRGLVEVPVPIYATARGEQHDFVLSDGSQLALGGLSTVSVDYSGKLRQLVLDAGEAYFEVAPNPSRPFVVQAGKLRVTAVRTAFNIRRSDDVVEVVVVHGSVDVRAVDASAADSSATQQLRLEAGRQIVTGSGDWSVRAADLNQALSWRSGSMVFVDENLALVVANLNRYATHPVVLVDPEIGKLRYTGIVVQGREEGWVAAMEAVLPVHATRDDQDRVLLSKK
jgi:transmembrane sensor